MCTIEKLRSGILSGIHNIIIQKDFLQTLMTLKTYLPCKKEGYMRADCYLGTLIYRFQGANE